MIKGRATIELRNIKTNKTEVIEANNTFMGNNITNYLKTYNIFNNKFNDNYWNIESYKNLVGGIFIFDKQIPEDSQYMPAGTKMIANGSYKISNPKGTSPVELGSWVEEESSLSENGKIITLVWEWDTAQANGTFNSICLTSADGGYIGYGNPSGQCHSTKIALDKSRSSTRNISDIFLLNDNNGYYTTVNYDTGIGKIYKRHISYSKASLIDFSWQQDEYKDFTLWTARTNVSSQNYIGDDELIGYVEGPYYSAEWGNGSSRHFGIVNLITGETNIYTVDNNTGVSLGTANSGFVYDGWHWHNMGGWLDKTHYLTRGYSNGIIYNIDIVNNKIEPFYETGIINKHTSNPKTFGHLPNNFTLIPKDVFTLNDNDKTTYMIYDPVNKTLYPTQYCPSNTSDCNINYNKKEDLLYYTSGNKINIINNPLYLGTINNLEKPLTKTNDQIMKITYTLTREE